MDGHGMIKYPVFFYYERLCPYFLVQLTLRVKMGSMQRMYGIS